ncbi:MAG: glutamine synthetase type III, partial [Syntrophaceae bacterium]
LLEPGHTPGENVQFLLFLSALIKAVDTHADILRGTCASAGNDHRLGANEAPPAIISIFMGEELTEILEKISKGQTVIQKGMQYVNVGVDTLPSIPRDNTDRNRTSPFAFTGNKFEFRMVGSSQSISGSNVALNTVAAEALDEIATRLEKAKNKNAEAAAIIKDIYKKHKRIIFNGNNYSEDWAKEAAKRGLPNVRNSVDALSAFITDKSVKLFEKYEVLSPKEVHSRYEIYIETYAKQINIEALAAIDMAKRQLIPAGMEYAAFLASSVAGLKAVSVGASVQEDILQKLSSLIASSYEKLNALEEAVNGAKDIAECVEKAEAYRDEVVTAMQALRSDIDAIEMIVPADMWPVPTYADLLFKL